MGKVFPVLVVALLLLPGAGRAHMSDACFAHVSQMEEKLRDFAKANSEISQLARTYEGESEEALRSGSLDGVMTGFSRLIFIQLPTLIDKLHHRQKLSMRLIEIAVAAIGCAVREKKPPTIIAPIDIEWLDEVMSGLEEQDPPSVDLGVDCSEPFDVSLPDDVLTECESNPKGR